MEGVDGWVVLLAKYSYMICRATGMKIKAGNEWGTVRVLHLGTDCLGRLLERAQTCLNTDSVFMCRGMTCDAGKTCVSRS